MGFFFYPCPMQGQSTKTTRTIPLSPRIGNFIMFAKHFRSPGGQCLCTIETIRETLWIGLIKVFWHRPVNDAIRQCHTRTTSSRNANRIHTATKKQTLRFSSFTKHKATIRGKTFRPIQQHPDFGCFQRG